MFLMIRFMAKVWMVAAIAMISFCTPAMAAGPLSGINSQSHFQIYYGNDFSAASLSALKAYNVVVIDPNSTNVTPAVVAELQNAGVIVLAYISLGEDQAINISTGDGSGPVYHNGTSLVSENNGYASFYVDQEWNGSAYVSDGVPDINLNFGSPFVLPNAEWRTVVNTQRRGGLRNLAGLAQIAGPRLSDTDTNSANNFGFNGFFLETLDTAGPYANTWGYYAWAAPAMQQTVKFIRDTYPNAAMMANRGLFFFNPALINTTYNIRPFDYTIRPYIDAVLFESYTLDYSNAVSVYHDDNKYNHAPKIMAEANRPDGFTVFSLDYATGKTAADLNFSYDQSVVQNGWVEHIAGTGGLADFYNFAETLPYPADISAPVWDNTAGQFALPAIINRVGVQKLRAGANAGEVVVSWDVARDQSLPIKYNVYVSQDGTTFPDKRSAVSFQMGSGWSIDPVANVANEFTVTGLVPGNQYCFRVRAEDSSPLNLEDSNTNSLCTIVNGAPLSEISNPLSGPVLLDGALADWAGLLKFGPMDPPDVPDFAGQIDILEVMMAHDANAFYLSYLNEAAVSLGWGYNLYIDTDSNMATGYVGGAGSFPVGADYLVQGSTLYQYAGTGTDWSWAYIASLPAAVGGNAAELSIARSLLGDPQHMRLFFYGDNNAAGQPYIDTAPDGVFTSGQYYAYYAAPVIPADTTPPVLTVPASIISEATAASSSVNIGTATAVDNVDGVVAVSNNSPVSFPLGTTTVTWSATDSSGNTATATQTVTIIDTTAPALTTPADLVVEATAVASSIAIGSASALDIVDGAVSVSNNAPATFPLGTTIVIWAATDLSGNTATATQAITVVDTTAPVLTVPADMVVTTKNKKVNVNIGTATATDIFGVTITNDAPATFRRGTTTVTWTATDANGNVSQAAQTITVQKKAKKNKKDKNNGNND